LLSSKQRRERKNKETNDTKMIRQSWDDRWKLRLKSHPSKANAKNAKNEKSD